MSTENTPVAPDTDDLDAFDDLLHGRSKPVEAAEGQASPDAVEEVNEEVDALEPNDDTHDEDAEDDEQEPEVKEDPKPKLTRSQKRINQLLEKNRLLEERVAAVEKSANPPEPKTVEAKTAPSPEDRNEDGTDKYPLGEMDPSFIRDLTRFTLAEEREAFKADLAKEAEEAKASAAKAELVNAWTEQLVPAQERYPDFLEKGQELLDTFQDIDARYGEYLEATIMSMENGTDVLYYLASNPEEADQIIKSGPTKATIALGRISTRFDKEETQPKIRPSKAPVPPPTNRGTSVSRSVPDDTDDLDAFAKKLFKK